MPFKLSERQRAYSKNLKLSIIFRRIQLWCKTNTQMKIWVFIFTMILWFFVVLNNRYSYTFNGKLEVRNISAGKVLKSRLPTRVQANFSGKGLDLFILLFSQRSGLKFIVDLETIKWRYDFLLEDYFRKNSENVIVPRGLDVRLEHIVWPESLRVELDVVGQVRFPVQADVELNLAPGYVLIDAPVITPDSVNVSGPQSALQQIAVIRTKKMAFRNVTASISREIELLVPELDNLKLEVRKIRFQQEVDQLSERTINNIPVIITGTSPGIKVEIIPSTVALTVTGGLSVLRKLKPEDISLTFDIIKDWKGSEAFYTPHITLPAGVISYSHLTPEKIEVRIIRERF